MKDQGVTPEKLYSTMPNEPEKVYPYVSLPASVFDEEEYQPGHECVLKIKVRIKMMTENNYDCELLESEEIESDSDDK